jgi:ribosome-associated protein
MVRARNVNKTKHNYETSDWEQEEFRSRTDIKKAAQAVTDLGEQLAQLPESTLLRMQLPDALVEAIKLLRKMDRGPALKRQKQYIGKYLRDNEQLLPEIKAFLEEEELKSKRQAQHFKQLEQWRDRLLAEGDDALNELIAAYPEAARERTQLRQWIRSAQKEQEKHQQQHPGEPPKLSKSAKAIFKYLRETLI